jgi:hypothetical protein
LLTIFGFVSQNIGKFIIFFFLKWKFEAWNWLLVEFYV